MGARREVSRRPRRCENTRLIRLNPNATHSSAVFTILRDTFIGYSRQDCQDARAAIEGWLNEPFASIWTYLAEDGGSPGNTVHYPNSNNVRAVGLQSSLFSESRAWLAEIALHEGAHIRYGRPEPAFDYKQCIFHDFD